jgi:hypothetical protein
VASVLEEEEHATLPLGQVFPEARFVVTGEQAAVGLPLAVEALCSADTSEQHSSGSGEAQQPVGAERECAFGPALQVLVDFLTEHKMGPS